MSKQEKTTECMFIPAMVAAFPDRKMRFHICEIMRVYSSESLIKKYPNAAERVEAATEVVKSKLHEKSLDRKVERFVETFKDGFREEVLNEAISVEVLKPLIYDAVKQLDIEGQERLDAVALAVHDLSKDVHDLSNFVDALNAGHIKTRETVGTQEGLVLAPRDIKKPKTPSTINPKKLHLKNFIGKNWKKRREEREIDEA